MTYAEHKAAVEKAADELHKAETAALEDNIKIEACIDTVLFMGGDVEYVVANIFFDIADVCKSYNVENVEKHKKAVTYAAIDLCAAFNAAWKDNYAFNVYLSYPNDTIAFPAYSRFFRHGRN